MQTLYLGTFGIDAKKEKCWVVFLYFQKYLCCLPEAKSIYIPINNEDSFFITVWIWVLLISDVEQLFTYLLDILFLIPFLIELYFCSWVWQVLSIHWILSYKFWANIFSQIKRCLFILLIISFEVQKLGVEKLPIIFPRISLISTTLVK